MMARLRESRWVYILLSILLAIIFWFYVRASVDPPSTTTIHNVRVETTGTSVLTSQGLTISEVTPQVVELRVEAPTSVLTSLIRHRASLYVVADVSRCIEGENTVNYKPSWPESFDESKLTLLEKEPSTITVTVEKLYTRKFDVEFQLDGKVTEGYQMGTPAIEPEQVIVSGPVEQVNQVDKVAAILTEDELKERFTGDLELVPLDKQGKALTDLELTLSAETAYVVVPVVMTKEVELTVNLLPGGGATEANAEKNINPPKIVVSGTEDDLEGLEEISLGSIDLSKVVGTNTFTFPITLDPSLTNESGLTTATVQVTVEGLDTEVFAVSNIRTINPPEGYNVDVVTQSILVTARGPAEDLAQIDASQFLVVADLSAMTIEGSRQVTAKVYLNGTSTVGVVGEYTISVNMSR